MSPSRKRRAKLTISKLFRGVVNGLFFAVAGSQRLASAGSLITKQWKWFSGDLLESEPANQPTHEELKPYRSCPITQFLAQASTGRAKNDVRRAKSKIEELRPNQRLKSS